MSYHPALLQGLAKRLDAEGFGIYREDGRFTVNERGIVVQTFPETPNEIIAVSLYLPGSVALSPTATRRLSTARVQIRYRLLGHPFAGIEMFDRLHELIDRKHLDLDGIRVTGEYKSYSPMTQSAAGNQFTSNWLFTGLASLPLVPPAG